MKDLQNKPGVTIALIVILIGAIVVTVVRIRGGTAAAGSRDTAQAEQSAAHAKYVPPTDDLPPARDPFGHSVLFAQPMLGTKPTEPLPDMQLPPSDRMPVLPLKIEGMRPRSPRVDPVLPGNKVDIVAKPEPELPALKLQAVVSGDSPLAIIKDDSGKTHFVHEGDQLGDGAVVARIINGTVAVRHGNSFSILSIERGSRGNEETQ